MLEVGCGSQGVAAFWDERVIGLDIDFSDYTSLARQVAPNLAPVMGDAGALPFPEGTFSHVLCIDVLEHIPPEKRSEVISECFRVCHDRVTIAFPYGTTAQSLDRRIYNYWRRSGLPVPRWLDQHRSYGLPSLHDVEKVMRRLPCSWRSKRGSWGRLHYWLERLGNDRRVGPYIAAMADFLSPKRWDSGGHRKITNLARALVLWMRPLLLLAAIIPGYRLFLFARRRKPPRSLLQQWIRNR